VTCSPRCASRSPAGAVNSRPPIRPPATSPPCTHAKF
jgi:hypothetical protein